ncbi:MAG: hypothetical protein KJT01_15600 [Gemmatimonadetes bacterium]|nr:hypothetical protein [Gemmatimonadota bacterium]
MIPAGRRAPEQTEALHSLLASDRVAARNEVRTALVESRDGHRPGLMDRLILAAAQGDGRTLLTLDPPLARLDGARLLE